MTRKMGQGVFQLLTDQSFLNALAAVIGPLAFFAAPTEEIEQLIYGAYEEAALETAPAIVFESELQPVAVAIAEAA